MYEVALGKMAEAQAVTQTSRDSGSTEDHDHALVGNKLKAIVAANGMEFPTHLNAEFQGRLDKIGGLRLTNSTAAYIHAMKKIHDADGAAFAKERFRNQSRFGGPSPPKPAE